MTLAGGLMRMLILVVKAEIAFVKDVLRRPIAIVVGVAVWAAIVVADHFFPTVGIADGAGVLFGVGFWAVAFRYAGTESARRAHNL